MEQATGKTYDMDLLERALRGAHNAGDVPAAQRIAREIKQARAVENARQQLAMKQAGGVARQGMAGLSGDQSVAQPQRQGSTSAPPGSTLLPALPTSELTAEGWSRPNMSAPSQAAGPIQTQPPMSDRERLTKLRRLKELQGRAGAPPIEVEGPGGVIVEFPPDTPRETMQAAMRGRFGGPESEDAIRARARERLAQVMPQPGDGPRTQQAASGPWGMYRHPGDEQWSPEQQRALANARARRGNGQMPTHAEASMRIDVRERLSALPADQLRPLERNVLSDLMATAERDDAAAADMGARLRGMQQGLTFNLSDEAGAAIRSAFGGDYDQSLAELRQRDQQARAASPSGYQQGEIAGALASGAVPVGLGANVARGANLGTRMMWSGLGGGVAGGLQGFGAGEGRNVTDGAVDRTARAVPGFGVGFGLGAAAPAVGAGLGAAARYATGRTVAPIGGLDRAGARKMVGDYTRSTDAGIDPAAELSRLGPEATLADVEGPYRATARGLAAMPGQGGATLGQILNARQRGSPERIREYLNEVLGPDSAAAGTRAAEGATRRDVISPLYDAALAAPDPINAGALVRAVDAHRADAGPSVRSKLEAVRSELARDGGQIAATRLHNIRSDISDDISEATRAGRNKQARALGEVLRPIDAELDRLPGYAEARAGYARSRAVEDALQEGRRALSGGPATVIRPAALRARLDAMTPEAREAFRQGTREWIADKLGTARNGPATVWGELLKDLNGDKLRIMLGD